MLDRHAVKLALERPPHKLIFLNALLSRIYAFLPRRRMNPALPTPPVGLQRGQNAANSALDAFHSLRGMATQGVPA